MCVRICSDVWIREHGHILDGSEFGDIFQWKVHCLKYKGKS